MIDVECMTCKYCGGALIQIDRTIWKCESCGRYAAVCFSSSEEKVHTDHSDGPSCCSCCLKLSLDDVSKEIDVSGDFEIIFEYKRRAVASDKNPATIDIKNGSDQMLFFENAPRFQYNKLSISVFDDLVKINCYRGHSVAVAVDVPFGKTQCINGLSIQARAASAD